MMIVECGNIRMGFASMGIFCIWVDSYSLLLHKGLYGHCFFFFFFKCSGAPRVLPSSPTRLSPDLSRRPSSRKRRVRPASSSHVAAPADAANLYQLLVESVTDYAIFVLDSGGNIRSWNPGAKRLKGYSESEIVGKHFSIFYTEEDANAGKPARELEAATQSGRVEDEGWRVRKDGTCFWANVIITALRDEHRTLLGFAKITRDLTARRNAEEQARVLVAETAARAEAERHAQPLPQPFAAVH